MPVYKDGARNTWYVKFKHKNWKGESKWVTKRGFKTKREATQWERDFEMREDGSLDMTFAEFVKVYRKDRKPRIKESTSAMKDNIISTKLIPHLGKMRIREITTRDVIQWQNEMLAYRDPNTGMPYSKSYLKTIHNQLSAVFNHAVRYYKLKENPAAIVGNMGSEKGIRMKYWTKEQYPCWAEHLDVCQTLIRTSDGYTRCIRASVSGLNVCHHSIGWANPNDVIKGFPGAVTWDGTSHTMNLAVPLVHYFFEETDQAFADVVDVEAIDLSAIVADILAEG